MAGYHVYRVPSITSLSISPTDDPLRNDIAFVRLGDTLRGFSEFELPLDPNPMLLILGNNVAHGVRSRGCSVHDKWEKMTRSRGVNA